MKMWKYMFSYKNKKKLADPSAKNRANKFSLNISSNYLDKCFAIKTITDY